MTVKLNLSVNDAPIATDYFVEGFIDHTVSGMIEALENTGKITDLDLSIDGDKVTVNLNGAVVPTNDFVNKIIKATIHRHDFNAKGSKPGKEAEHHSS